MKDKKRYNVVLKHDEVRELQLALIYHTDTVLIPYLEKEARERDYYPTDQLRKRISCLQHILEELNRVAGTYQEDD